MKLLSNLALLSLSLSLVSATPLPLQNVLELNLDATESEFAAPAKKPLVDSDALQALITEDDLRTGSEALWNISQFTSWVVTIMSLFNHLKPSWVKFTTTKPPLMV
ncbi:unnamed protein product [Ambrosiozyma monospora]|uniref:Unnamed protein product n=1 Tax=Ambrosiozyma monospora TaxID=43982 RepID=A0ACB5TZ79_AMBMO|nr:unnamed protein product [Ambrosiozyma monospora]